MRIETIEATELTDAARNVPCGQIIPLAPGHTYDHKKAVAYKVNPDGLTVDLYLED